MQSSNAVGSQAHNFLRTAPRRLITYLKKSIELILAKKANCKLFCKQQKIKVMNLKRAIGRNALPDAISFMALFPGKNSVLET